MTHGLLTVLHFLVSTAFNLLLLVLWLRMFLRYFRISYLHPISSMVNRFTDFLVYPLQNLIKNPVIGRVDISCLGAIIFVEILKFSLLGLIVYGRFLPFIYLMMLVLADLIIQPCHLLFYALLAMVVMSWVNPMWRAHPMHEILVRITRPLIDLGHRLVPNISGFDFAPLVMMIGLKVITLFITASIASVLL
ncbi:MAG TPA: YggT family protein [Legionellales bacterium]|nr:YggT family protein [Legionellales bacterium]|tara:strand:+ start:3348 stop:3923 length:576 start_codon:yes stop_codon:yes gene_type:complete